MIRLYIIDNHFLIYKGFCASFDLPSDDFRVVGGILTIGDALKEISVANVEETLTIFV